MYDGIKLRDLYNKANIMKLYEVPFQDFVFDIKTIRLSPEERKNLDLGKLVNKLVVSYKANKKQ